MSVHILFIVSDNEYKLAHLYNDRENYKCYAGTFITQVINENNIQNLRSGIKNVKMSSLEESKNNIEFVSSQIPSSLILNRIYNQNVVQSINATHFVQSSRLVDSAYLIDLDREVFELYLDNNNRNPLSQQDRFHNYDFGEDQVRPIRLCRSFTFKQLREGEYERFLQEFVTDNFSYIQGY